MIIAEAHEIDHLTDALFALVLRNTLRLEAKLDILALYGPCSRTS